MRKIIILLCVLISHFGLTQKVEDIGKISLSVIIPDRIEGVDASNSKKLETKIFQIVTASGLAASGQNNSFIIYPQFLIVENNVVEGGMQNITVVNTELTLFIKQYETDLVFSSTSVLLKGSGSTTNLALSDAVSKINIADEKFKQFIEVGKGKIFHYYEENCQDIINRASSIAKMQDYEKALSLLMTVPFEVSSCYHQILEKSIEVYKSYQNHKCSAQIQQAKTLIADKSYDNALAVIEQIDPASSCFNTANDLVKSIEPKINAEEQKQRNFRMKQYNDAKELEKERIRAIKEVVVAYYNSQPKTINTNYIIK